MGVRPQKLTLETFMGLLDTHAWRLRRSDRHVCMSHGHYSIESTFHLVVTVDVLKDAARMANAKLDLGPPGTEWRQEIPVARLPKVVPHEFEVRDGSGCIVPHLPRSTAAHRGAEFLWNHFVDAFDSEFGKAQQSERLDWSDAGLGYWLLCFCNPSTLAEKAAQAGLVAGQVEDMKSFEWLTKFLDPMIAKTTSLSDKDAPPATLSDQTVRQLEEFVKQQAPLISKLKKIRPHLVPDKPTHDPLLNPLLLLYDHAKKDTWDDTPFQSVDAVVSDGLLPLKEIQSSLAVCLRGFEEDPDPTTDWLGLIEEMRNFVQGWVVIVELPVAVDRAFVVQMRRLERHIDAPTTKRGEQVYEQPYGDALSHHFELCLEDSELAFANRGRVEVSLTAQVDSLPTKPRKAEDFYSTVIRSPGRLHLYSARRRPWTFATPALPKSLVVPPVRVTVKLRPRLTILAVYWGILAAVVTADVWVAAQAGNAWRNPQPSVMADMVVAVLALAALLILFGVARHRHAMVERRLRVLTGWIVMGLIYAVLAALALTIRALVV